MIIPYLGNKEKFTNFISPNIPLDISTYVEPFGGMMGIFFTLDFTKFKNVEFIYNDKNKLNYLLFKNLNNSNFIKLFKNTKVDKEYYQSCLKNLYVDMLFQLIIINFKNIDENKYSGCDSHRKFL